MENIKIKLFNVITEQKIIDEWYQVYLQFLFNHKSSVQKKPIFNFIDFKKKCTDQEFFKIAILKNDKMIAFFIATKNIKKYPESHYSSEYFNNRKLNDKSWINKDIIFFIGDSFGLVISKENDKLFQGGSLRFKNIITEIAKILKNHLKKEVILIFNYSELSLKITNYHFSSELIMNRKQNTLDKNFEQLDDEVFVYIHWHRRFRKKTRAEFLLSLIGDRLNDSPKKYNENDFYKKSQPIYRITSKFFKKFIVAKCNVVPDTYVDKCYNLYDKRLSSVNHASPQKLKYSKEVFINYLKDQSIVKYLLIEKSEIKGLYMLIGKEHSNSAHWVSPSWRLADAYIKLILTEQGTPSYGYAVLFLSGTRDLLNNQGTTSDARILADWSENIHGKRFKEDLNIISTPLLPKIVKRNIVNKKGHIFTEMITKFARFQATQIDSDVYLAYYS